MINRPAFRRPALGVALLVLSGASAEAQQPPPRDRSPAPTVGTGTIRGHVVDGATGTEVARARVRLQGVAPHSPVLTDSTGAFEFTKLPAAPYVLVADKSTYLIGRYPDPERSLRAMRKMLTLREGQVVKNVTVKIFRGGVIAGRVVDAYGDPVESADVRVVSAAKEMGRMGWRGGVQTNDLGEFRISRLDAGRYLVAVMPQRTFNEDPPVPSSQPLAEPLPTYYPGALSVDQAQPITIGKGQTVTGIEIVLGEGTPTIVSGVVLSKEGPPVAGSGDVNARSVGAEGLAAFSGSGTGIRPDGTFRLKLPPGEYVLEARAARPGARTPRQPDNEQFGTARVSVGIEAIEGVSIVIGRGAAASGRVVFDGATPLPSNPGQVRLPIYSQDGLMCRAGEATIAADWSFRIDGLFGTCEAPMLGMFGRWTLKAVMYRGQDLLDRPVTFEAGQRLSDVQVIFTDRRTELTLGVAGDDGQPTRNYVAIVFSADKERWSRPSRYLRTFVPPTDEQIQLMMASRRVATSATPRAAAVPSPDFSRQAMSGLPPGDYYAIAVDDIDGEASRDPAVLERLMSSATRVTVTHDAAASVALQRIKLSDVVR